MSNNKDIESGSAPQGVSQPSALSRYGLPVGLFGASVILGVTLPVCLYNKTQTDLQDLEKKLGKAQYEELLKTTEALTKRVNYLEAGRNVVDAGTNVVDAGTNAGTNPDMSFMEGLSENEKAYENVRRGLDWANTKKAKDVLNHLIEQISEIFEKYSSDKLLKNWNPNVEQTRHLRHMMKMHKDELKDFITSNKTTKMTRLVLENALKNAISLDHQELFAAADELMKAKKNAVLKTQDEYANFFLNQYNNLEKFYNNISAQPQIKHKSEDVRTKINAMKQALVNAVVDPERSDQRQTLKDAFSGEGEFKALWEAISEALKSFPFAAKAHQEAQKNW